MVLNNERAFDNETYCCNFTWNVVTALASIMYYIPWVHNWSKVRLIIWSASLHLSDSAVINRTLILHFYCERFWRWMESRVSVFEKYGLTLCVCVFQFLCSSLHIYVQISSPEKSHTPADSHICWETHSWVGAWHWGDSEQEGCQLFALFICDLCWPWRMPGLLDGVWWQQQQL